MSIKFPLLCLVKTSTTGNSSPYVVDESSIKPGYRSLTRAVADGSLNDGDTVYYECRDSTVVNGPNLFEYGIGTWNNTTKQLARTTILQSSNGTTAVTWGAGTRDLVVSDSFAALFLQAANNLSDLANIAAALATLGIGTAGLLNTGTASGNIPVLGVGGKLPPVDGSQLTNLPSSKLPTGTKVPFAQDTVPTGWSQVTSIDDAVFMCTSGSGHGGVVGGALVSASSGLNSWQVSWALGVGGHALSLGEIPAQGSIASGVIAGSNGSLVNSSPTATGHTHPITDSKTWRPPYLALTVGVAL